MGTTLQHGIFLPAEGERNCYAGLASNWTIIDGVVGGYSAHAANTTIHVTAADKEAWNGKADTSALTAHTGNTTIHVTAEDKTKWDAVTGKADASALTAHTGNTTIHVTAEDKEAWNGKADASALTAHTGNTTIHVTAADKEAWNGKANDTDVLHKSGDETKTGKLTVTELNTTKINNLNPGALSLPDLTSGVDISGYITTGNTDNNYTPSVDGWIWIRLIGNGAGITQGDFGINANYVANNLTGEKWVETNLFVTKNVQATIRCRSITGIVSAKFYPCTGNV